MRYQIIVILIAILFALNPAIAQEKTKQPAPHLSTSLVSSDVKMDATLSSKEQIAALREQNTIIRDYQGSLLSTVYWALGGVFAMAALLTGFSWWTNNKIYELDKSRFREEVTSQIKEMESRVSLQLEASRTEFLRLVESRIDANNTKFTSDMSEIKKNIETVKSDIEKSISAVRMEVDTVGNELKETKVALSDSEWDLRSVESYVWELKGVPSNILLTQAQGVEAAIKSKNKWRIENTIEAMKKTISEEIIPKNYTMRKDVIDMIRKKVEKADSYNSIALSELSELFQKIKVSD